MVLLITEESAWSTPEYDEGFVLKEFLSCAQVMVSFSKTTSSVSNPLLPSYTRILALVFTISYKITNGVCNGEPKEA